MKSKNRLRRVHRWVSVMFGVQVLFWVLGGLYFAWTDIESIRGADLRAEPRPLRLTGDWVSPAAFRTADEIASLDVVRIGDHQYYRMRPVDGEPLLVDVLTGRPRAELDRTEAETLARASFLPEADVASVDYLTDADVGAHHEYRDQPLPAWRVAFDHSSGTRVYVAAREATVQAHRNRSWRIFDFLWMLHTMDFLGRDDINNPLLRTFSLIALAIVLSGFWLWGLTRRRTHR